MMIRSIYIVCAVILCGAILLQDKKSERDYHEDYIVELGSHEAAADIAIGLENPADHPELAALQEFVMTVDPTLRRVPAERRNVAWKAFRESQDNMRGGGKGHLEWNEIPADMGGRTRALAWDPGDTTGHRLYAGAVTGGLWVNENIHDSTSLWTPVPGIASYMAISSILFDPLDPSVMYVGTGESQTALVIYRESSGLGSGILKSIDGGSTWNLLPSSTGFAYVSDMAARVENGQTVIYAGVVSGIYKGSNHVSSPSDGLFRSTDGGQNWQQVLPNISGTTKPYPVADIELGANDKIYVGTQKNLNGKGGACILHSKLGTAGGWTLYDNMISVIQASSNYYVPGRVVLGAAPSDSNTVYAAFGAGYYNSSGYNYARGRHILKTTDQGSTWTSINLPQQTGGGQWATLSWHALTLGVDPNDALTFYAGGLDQHRTTNQGQSWTHLSDWAAMYNGGGQDYIHADQHKVLYFPGSSDTIVFATDGGVFYTSNGSAQVPVFQQHNRDYNTLQFYTCAINKGIVQDSILGGLQDNGTLLATSPPVTVFDMISGGDGAYCFFDEDEQDLFYTSVYYNSYYIFAGGAYQGNSGTGNTGTFICPADYHSAGNVIYANAATSWGQYTDRILRISGLPYIVNDQMFSLNTGSLVPFSFVGVSPHSTNQTTLFVGSQSGRLFKVSNANTSPFSSDIGTNLFPTANLSCVAVGGSNDTLLATFSNYGVKSIWLSTNGGSTWTDVEGNLPDMPVRWALFAPGDSRKALIATEMGVWYCHDLLAALPNWAVSGSGMPPVRTDMIRYRSDDATLLAGTHGRGFWKSTWSFPNTNGIGEKPLSTLDIFPNPASDRISLGSLDREAVVQLFDLNGNLVLEGEVDPDNSSLNVANLSVGTYLVTVIYDNMTKSSKLLIAR